MSRFLKLVGANVYTHAAFGTAKKGDTVGPLTDEQADRLLEKGTSHATEHDDDVFVKPFFVEADAPKGKAAPRVQTEEEARLEAEQNAELQRRLAGTQIPQAPTGEGPHGAETLVDESEQDVDAQPGDAQDPAYHSNDPADNDGDDGISDAGKNEAPAESAATTARATRQRSAAATTGKK